MIIEEELAAAPFANPALDRHDLHEVVSQSDSQDGHGRDVEQRIELANLADERNGLEVLIEELVDLARVMGFPYLWLARVGQSAKGQVRQHALGEEED